MNITLIKTNGQGWEFPCENNWPCTVAFALGDPPNPVTEEEADRQAKLIAAAPELLFAARCALADLEGVMPEFEVSGDREHSGWQTIKELKAVIKKATK